MFCKLLPKHCQPVVINIDRLCSEMSPVAVVWVLVTQVLHKKHVMQGAAAMNYASRLTIPAQDESARKEYSGMEYKARSLSNANAPGDIVNLNIRLVQGLTM